MKSNNPRYQIFFDTFGQQPTYAFIIFISRMRTMFTEKHGTRFNHDTFTDFIKANANKVELTTIT